MKRVFLVGACSVLVSVRIAFAQCPDGTPPPCRPRRERPLDERTWLVLPFANLARAPDLNWLSQAAVNLLYVDMSRWTDIRVVDDGRVADLLRETPEAGRSQLGLQAGLAVARRAGAGKLVMGDVLREGPRTAITAKVYDVRTGSRVRTVTQRIVGTDSLSVTFSRLALQVLAVPPPAGTTLGGIGTASAEAVRAYTLGMQALNRWRSDSAVLHFRRAIALDSTFALAHLRLAIGMRTWGPEYAEARRSAFEAAQRHAGAIPERERLVIARRQPSAGRDAHCNLGGQLLAHDSADAEGWLGIGSCHLLGDRVLVGPDGQIRPQTSWNDARRALHRALELQPGWEPFQALMVLYTADARVGCSVAASPGPCPADSVYWAASVLEGDTIATRFERRRRFDPPWRRRDSFGGRRARLTAVRALAERWTAANPRDLGGRFWYGAILGVLGDVAGAERELAAAAELSQVALDQNRLVNYNFRTAIELWRERPDRARLLLDSAVRSLQPWDREQGITHLMTTFGQFSRDLASDPDTSPRVRALRATFLTGFAGAVPLEYEQTVRAFAAARGELAPIILELGTALGFHVLRTGPALDTASAFPLFRYQAFFARGDTARARRALAEYDEWADSAAEDFRPLEVFSAESHLELGDTAIAWERIGPFGQRWPRYGPGWFWIAFADGGFLARVRAAGRAWLLYGDLAMATGHWNEARRGYRMVVGLWEHGEPPVQPLVARAQATLARLGN